MSNTTKLGYLVIVVGVLTALSVRPFASAQVSTVDPLLRELTALRKAEEAQNQVLRDILAEMKRHK
jgi:hypothetical protein